MINICTITLGLIAYIVGYGVAIAIGDIDGYIAGVCGMNKDTTVIEKIIIPVLHIPILNLIW